MIGGETRSTQPVMGVAGGHCGEGFRLEKHLLSLVLVSDLVLVWPILAVKMSSENLEWGEVSLKTDH